MISKTWTQTTWILNRKRIWENVTRRDTSIIQLMKNRFTNLYQKHLQPDALKLLTSDSNNTLNKSAYIMYVLKSYILLHCDLLLTKTHACVVFMSRMYNSVPLVLKWTSIAFIPSSKVFTCYCRDSCKYRYFVNGEGT